MANSIYGTNANLPVAFPRPVTSPVAQPPATAVGGGAIPVDPTGLVPVNRVQPIAGSISDAQRLAENRAATMPPSSFSGAGASFVPVDRPSSPIYTPANMATNQGWRVAPVGQPAALSAQ